MSSLRQPIDPSDLVWSALASSRESSAEPHHAMDAVIQSLAETRARCRSLSERAFVRSIAPTLPELPAAKAARVSSEVRTPTPGPTDVVTLPRVPIPGTGPRPRTVSERARIAAALRPPK